MNKIINKFLSVGDTFMSEKHLRQTEFTWSAGRSFTKDKERIQKMKKTEDSRYTYQNGIHKACSQHDMDYGDFKDLPRRTDSDKVLHNKPFINTDI